MSVHFFRSVLITAATILVLLGVLVDLFAIRGVQLSSAVYSKAFETSAEVTESKTTFPFQMVVALLYNNQENWKKISGDTGLFLLDEAVKDIPTEVMSMDPLYDPNDIQKTFRPEHAYSKLLSRKISIEFVPLLNGKRAQECPAYLTHILRNYDNLPDVSIFLHSRPDEHGNPHILQDIRYIVEHWKPEEIGFLHLNRHPICRPANPQQGSDLNWATGWSLLGFNESRIPRFIQLQCCAQFMVTRERILLRPRWFWEQLLKFTYEIQKCSFQEHYWHIFFGDHPLLPEERAITYYRERDNAGNLIGEWKPPQKAVLTHPYPNVPYSDSMAVWYEKSVTDPTYYTNLTGSTCEQTREPSVLRVT